MATYKSILSTLEKGFINKTPIYLEKNMGSLSGGRRLAKNDVAGGAYDVFDLGEDERTISLNLYVTGDDFYAQAERLIKVLNSGDELELVHPFFRKKMNVLVKTWTYDTVSETYQSIKATFTILYKVQTSYKDKLNDFWDKISKYLGEGAYYLAQGMNAIKTSVKTIDNVSAMFSTIEKEVGGLLNDLKNGVNFIKRFNDLKGGVSGLIGNATSFLDGIKTAFTFDSESLIDKKVIESLLDAGVAVAGILTKEGDGFDGLVKDAVVLSLLSNYATVVQSYGYKNTEEQKDHIYKLDLILNASKTSSVYDQLLNMKNECVKYLYDNMATKVYSKTVSDNILNAVFKEYGSIDNLDDILLENAIDDPFFIKGKEVKFYAYN